MAGRASSRPIDSSTEFMSKKEFERLKREIDEREAKARSESEDRQEKIKVLSKECRGLPNLRDFNELLDELEKLPNKYGSLSDRVRLLHQLAELQDREIEYLTQFREDWELIRAYYPEQLENLRAVCAAAQLQPFIEILLAGEDPKKSWEYKRLRYKLPGGIGLIEYEFGGAGETEWRKLSSLSDMPYQPRCLDDIFKGGTVKMHDSEGHMFFIGTTHRIPKPGLELLFGMHRNRFPKDLPRRETDRETLYDWHAVEKIMKALLSEKQTIREKGSRGGSQRTLWPAPNRRVRVLQGIKDRMNNISVPKHVKPAFLRIIRPYLPDSAK